MSWNFVKRSKKVFNHFDGNLFCLQIFVLGGYNEATRKSTFKFLHKKVDLVMHHWKDVFQQIVSLIRIVNDK